MKKKIIPLLILASITLFVFYLSRKTESPSPNNKKHSQHQRTSKPNCKDVHWSHHKGEEGPAHWKNLCDKFSSCAGKSQSPINFVTKKIKVSEDLTEPIFSYKTSTVDIINNGHTVQFNTSGQNKVNLNGKDYDLLQFHFHASSEHTIDGEHYPIEAHFVHKHSDIDYAVLGIMFEEGKSNDLFELYLNQFPKKKGEYKNDDLIDLISLFPENKSYYNYSGSLTTPPCSEVVNWYIMQNPVKASKEQIEKFSLILHNNFRPTMPMNDREVRSFSK